jgi:uncharacterized protein YdeI (YjbR/CyaY-like superfamily)
LKAEREIFDPVDRKDWREWLKKNHKSSTGVWLIIQKKDSNKKGITLDDAVEEAVSFGWIDSKMQPVDEDHYRLFMTPRKPGSTWSKSNKTRVEKLIRSGLMTNAGFEKVEAAKRDGSWDKLNAIDELIIPEDFAEALSANSIAKRNFESFTDSTKKQIFWWIESAKRMETRRKRVEQASILAAQNKRPFSS